jgi:integrase
MKLRILTDFAVQKAKPKPEGYEMSDGGQRGLRLAVHPTGRKSWVVRYRHPVTGKSRKLTLQPGLGLAQARKLAADAMFAVAQGTDPIDGRRAEKQAAVAATEGTLAAITKQYLDIAASKLRSHDFYKGVLDRHILPRLGERQVVELKRSEIVACLDLVESKSGPSASDMARAVLSAVLSWHEGRSDTFKSPIVKSMKRRVSALDAARGRVLTDDELKRVWQAAGDARIGVYGQVVRLMVLTGARRSEAQGLRRDEIETVHDNGSDIVVWRLPASRSKSKREIVRPLSAGARAIIDDQPQIGECDFVFTLDGNRAMSMNRDGAKKLIDEIADVKDWRLHDLRRVHRSLLSRCRVPFEIAERLLGHSQPTLVQTYDRHSHLPAMAEAVEKLAAEIERIISGRREADVIRPGAFNR